MRMGRLLGLAMLALGLALLVSFLSTSINPNVTLGNLGLLALLLGGLLLTSDLYVRRVRIGPSFFLAAFGWSVLSAGLLVTLTGFLLGNQVVCSCPANGPCTCDVALYDFMFYGGLLVAFVGATSLIGGTVLSRRRRTPASQETRMSWGV